MKKLSQEEQQEMANGIADAYIAHEDKIKKAGIAAGSLALAGGIIFGLYKIYTGEV